MGTGLGTGLGDRDRACGWGQCLGMGLGTGLELGMGLGPGAGAWGQGWGRGGGLGRTTHLLSFSPPHQLLQGRAPHHRGPRRGLPRDPLTCLLHSHLSVASPVTEPTPQQAPGLHMGITGTEPARVLSVAKGDHRAGVS